MDVDGGLEHEEVKQGFILTFQSHPLTEKVVVDFDINSPCCLFEILMALLQTQRAI